MYGIWHMHDLGPTTNVLSPMSDNLGPVAIALDLQPMTTDLEPRAFIIKAYGFSCKVPVIIVQF
jgi:hypothetical protein